MQIEHQTDQIRVYAVGDGYRRAAHFPKNLAGTASFVNIPGRRVSEIIIHHSAGGVYEGQRAVDELAEYFTAPPTYRLDEHGQRVLDKDGEPIKIGGGRGWPAIPYTFVVPAIPALEDGRLVVYRIWSDTWRTWHTGGVHNSHGVAVCVGGWYASRRDTLASQARERPTEEAVAALDGLVDYLAQRYSLVLKPGSLLAHREAGGTACPGDFLESWVRVKRGEAPLAKPPSGPKDMRDLSTVRALQEALVELGYDPGKVDGLMGPRTANALRAFQRRGGLLADGVLGPLTEAALRRALYRPA